jgi:hypothetical protein
MAHDVTVNLEKGPLAGDLSARRDRAEHRGCDLANSGSST